jgi:hypothetical protein
LPIIEPWLEPVDGAALLNGLASTIREYVIVTDAQADAAALWNVHTHTHDASDVSPKLILKSAQKRSGKTRLVGLLARTVAKPLFVSGITPAALLRIIEMKFSPQPRFGLSVLGQGHRSHDRRSGMERVTDAAAQVRHCDDDVGAAAGTIPAASGAMMMNTPLAHTVAEPALARAFAPIVTALNKVMSVQS